jgi:hypothetical protein
LDDQGTSSAAEICAQAHFWVEIRVAFRLSPRWTRLTLDRNNNGVLEWGDTLSHNQLDTLLNGGYDTVDTQPDGAVAGVDDPRTVVFGGHTLVLPTLTEILALSHDPAYPAAGSAVYWTSTLEQSAVVGQNPSYHDYVQMNIPFVASAYDGAAAAVMFQVL